MTATRKKRRHERKGTVGSLRPNVPRKKMRPATESVLHLRVRNLTEHIDSVVPELTARVASLEHLLLKLNLCSHTDLRQAREFVNAQEE